jgi:hypothetical protein
MSTTINDTGTGSSKPLPVETAWALISEGLHIHRYFLHVDPLLKEFYAKKLERLEGINTLNHEFKPGEPGSWQTAVINHLSEGNFASVVHQLAALAPEEARGILILVQDSATVDELHFTPAKSEPMLAEATALIRSAELGFLIDLTVGVIDTRQPSSAPAFQPSSPRTVSIPISETAFAIADGLLRAGASQLVQLFALARFENTENRNEDPDILLAPFADGLATVGEAVGAAFVLRFYEALATQHPGAQTILNEQRASLLESATTQENQIQVAVKRVDYLPFTDLVETLLPTPRQFRKFQEGAGPGQST